MTLSTETEQLLQWFIIIAGVLLIPVFIGISILLFKASFLLHSTSEFVRLASYELTPILKDLGRLSSNLGNISHKASSGVQELGSGIHHITPLVKKGLEKVKLGTSAVASGISRSFERSS